MPCKANHKVQNIHVNEPNNLSAPNNSRKQATIFGAKKKYVCVFVMMRIV